MKRGGRSLDTPGVVKTMGESDKRQESNFGRKRKTPGRRPPLANIHRKDV